MNFKRENGLVHVTLKNQEFDLLLMGIGMAAGLVSLEGNKPLFRQLTRLANAVNDGNPDFNPYDVPPEKQ